MTLKAVLTTVSLHLTAHTHFCTVFYLPEHFYLPFTHTHTWMDASLATATPSHIIFKATCIPTVLTFSFQEETL